MFGSLIRSHFKASLVHIRKNNLFSAINLLSLLLGIGACIIVGLSISSEMGYDRFQENLRNICLVQYEFLDQNRYHNGSPAPLGPLLKEKIPDIVNYTRFAAMNSDVVHCEEKEFLGNHFNFADPSVFSMFTFEFIEGKADRALDQPYSLVLTESASRRFFGEGSALGKVLTVGKYQPEDYVVTAVVRDLPEKTTLNFDGLGSFKRVPETRWGIKNFPTYVLLSPAAKPRQVEEKIQEHPEDFLVEDDPEQTRLFLQPLKVVHLDVNPFNKVPSSINNTGIYMYALVGLLLLLIAVFNYLNLSSAMFLEKHREFWIRKVHGALNSHLARYTLMETYIQFIFATVCALFLAQLIVPIYNRLSGNFLKFGWFDSAGTIFLIFGLVLLTGLLAGLYLTILPHSLSNEILFSVTKRGRLKGNRSVTRKLLVVIQLVVAIVFVSIALQMNRQVNYLYRKDLGFGKDTVMVLPFIKEEARSKLQLVRSELMDHPGILGVAATSYSPDEKGLFQNIKCSWETDLDMINWISADSGMIETLGLEIAEGENFRGNVSGNEFSGYILNKTAVEAMGIEDPIGRSIDIIAEGPVVGIVKDFHFKSLHDEIQPLAICTYPDEYKYLYIKLDPSRIQESVTFIGGKWNELVQGEDFKFSFLDQILKDLYDDEYRTQRIFNIMSLVILVIACLGIFGISILSTSHRTREISIRKVNGAEVRDIVFLIMKEYIVWIVISLAIAAPIVYYYLSYWLRRFAYRLPVSWPLIILAGFIILAFVLLTTSWYTFKAARRNPKEFLRYE